MLRGILFVPVAASSALFAVAPGDVRANIRECRYYVEVLPSGKGEPEADPRLSYSFAVQCRDDSSLPMREVAVLRSADFNDLNRFKLRIREFLSRWLAAIGAHSATA